MEHLERLQQTLDHIEAHLRAELTAGELAQMAGYSVYHYSRIFRAATGMSVGHYILRRRLLHGGYAMARGKSGVDAAAEYGFDTYAGFYRAFLREFGCTPSEYLRSSRGKKPWRIDLSKEERTMTHKDAARVLKHWGLEGEKMQDLLVESTGAQRDDIVQVGAGYFLKRTAQSRGLESHLALTRALAAAGLLTPVPVPTLAGGDWYAEEGYCYTLTERLPGRTVTARELLDPEAARQEGAAIATLHRVLAGVEATAEKADLLKDLKGWALKGAKEALGLTNGWCENYLAELEGLWPELPRQIIHRDLCPGNLVRSGDDWGFLDFELSQRNIRIYDVVYAAGAVLSETFGREEDRWLESWKALLAGYSPAENERRAAPLVLLGSQFVCVAWFAGQEKYRDLFEINKKMTHWLLERMGELK